MFGHSSVCFGAVSWRPRSQDRTTRPGLPRRCSERSISARPAVVAVFLAGGILLAPGEAPAQYGPGGYYGPGWGAWPSLVAEQRYDTTRSMAAAYKRQSQALATQQLQRGETEIQNTLLAQAKQRTQTSRQSAQGYRDWWLQQQDRQFTADRARRTALAQTAGPMPAGHMPSVTEPMLASTLTVSPQAKDDVIQWPRVLQDARFDEGRATIEAPFRRAKEDGTPISADDYRRIIATVEQMQKTLGQMASELRGDVLMANNRFLELLASQARERIAARQQAAEADGEAAKEPPVDNQPAPTP